MSRNFDAIIIGTGQAGPSLASRFSAAGMRVAMDVFPQKRSLRVPTQPISLAEARITVL